MKNFSRVIGLAFFVFAATVAAAATPSPNARFEGKDSGRKKIAIRLAKIAEFRQPTDIQFLPDASDVIIVLEKEGRVRWRSLSSGNAGTLLTLKVLTWVEQGLLGIAFHPDFAKNRRFYVNYNPASGFKRTRIAEFRLPKPSKRADLAANDLLAAEERIVLEIPQPPYPNHKAGQLQFGPDGYLYIGTGDGGSAGDPHGNAQNPNSLLGKMLRIDVNKPDAKPEIVALGLRNPWRFSFDPLKRLIVADVGQDLWEEISIVRPGRNYGWNIREGKHCFKPPIGCRTEGLTDPIYEYGRNEGGSITGGYVYAGAKIPELKGRYVFGDFVSKRIWAAAIPGDENSAPEIFALGKWPILPSTFGRDASGEIYVADYGSGAVFRLDPAGR